MSPPSLLLFTTSQTPLAVRYPHPARPSFVITPLLHRSLHGSLDRETPSVSSIAGTICIPNPEDLSSPSPLPVPSDDAAPEAVCDETELTVKVHLVAPSSGPSPEGKDDRAEWVSEAIATLQKTKGLDLPDNLLIGLKGIDYRGKKTDSESIPVDTAVPASIKEAALSIWSQILPRQQDLIKPAGKFGTLYYPLELLSKLVGQDEKKSVKVNAMDTPDCHHLPKEYTAYARGNGVELWASGGGEGSDPIPAAHLQNVLLEFIPNLRKSLPHQSSLFDKIDKQIPVGDDGEYANVQTGLEVRWVLSYTVVSKTRNVIEDKGYIIAADIAN